MWFLRKISLRHARAHKVRTLLAAVGVAIGASTIIATKTVNESAAHAFDSSRGAALLDLLRLLVDREGRSVILVTHDMSAAARGDRLVGLRDGRVESHEGRQRSTPASVEAADPIA